MSEYIKNLSKKPLLSAEKIKKVADNKSWFEWISTWGGGLSGICTTLIHRFSLVFGLKKVILGLCDPIFLALGVKYIALFGILRVGWFTPIFLKNSSNDTMSFFDLYQIMDLLCLVSPWLTKRRARFPALRMKAKASGNRFWACMRQFCDLGVNFWPRKVFFDPWDSILSLWDSISSLWKFTSGHKKANLGFWESILGA